MLPFPSSRILPYKQIPILSVIVQNPPALLPPKSVCPLPICPSRRCRSQPLTGVSRKQRYKHTRLSEGKSCANRGAARPYWKTRAKGTASLWTPHLFVQWLSILLLHAGYAPARTGKTGTEIRPDSGQISVPVLFDKYRKSVRQFLVCGNTFCYN